MELSSEKKKVAFYSVLINLFLAFIKITAGWLSNSKSLLADGIHSFADFAGALSVLVGITIANMRVRGYPYGLYKVENIVSLISAGAIFFAGYEILRETLLGKGIGQIERLPVAVAATVITILVTYYFSKFELKKGRELNSPSLIADAEHVKTDMFSSIVVLTGILGNYSGYPIVEKFSVLIISLLIFHAGYEITVEAVKVLLDASVDAETLEKVKKLVESHPLIGKVKKIAGRSSGSFKFIEVEVTVKTNDLEKAHRAVHEVEAIVKREIPFIEKLIIHFEPEEKKPAVFSIPVDGEKVCSKFADCPEVVILTLKEGKIEDFERIENPVRELKHGKCIELVEFLARKGVNCIAVNSLPPGKGVMYALSAYDMGIRLISEENLNLFIHKLKENPYCEQPLVVWNSQVCSLSEELKDEV
jgi:cation diffusion facilitator family transporter